MKIRLVKNKFIDFLNTLFRNTQRFSTMKNVLIAKRNNSGPFINKLASV